MNIQNNEETITVLVVEDSKVTMKVLGDFLGHLGIIPLMAASGAMAIDIYHREQPDIILLDAQLPDIDGFEVALKIRALEKVGDWTAIIFLTSMTSDEDLARGIEVGGDDYLMKPISEVVLKAKVRAMMRLLEMQRALVKLTQELNDANVKLQRLSATDGLTGIANRRMFDELGVREWRRCERMRKPLALVMVDVDHFKLFNDKYGHQAGDECLKRVADQVGKVAPRATDLAARYGGEEFVLVLGETDTDGAKWIANRLRQQVSELNIPHYATESRHVTISCGLASIVPDSRHTLDVLIKSADHALYQAKKAGRDQVGMGVYGVTG